MSTPNAITIQEIGKEPVAYVSAKMHHRMTIRLYNTFRLHDAWRGGSVKSINALVQRAEDAERQLRAILDGDEWTYPVENEAVRASVTRVLRDNEKLTGNY